MAPPVDWHPRRLARPTEWTLVVPGRREPIAVVRLIETDGQICFRAVTWARTTHERLLIGHYQTGDAAAEACWRRFCDDARAQHDVVSRMHGGRERGGPTARAE